MLTINQILQQRYRISGVLGHGGMGAVYHAFDYRTQIQCVIKEMLVPSDAAHQSTDAADQFRREATTLAALRHPNLPRVTDYFVEAGHNYLVMDFIEGHSLDQLIGPRGLPQADVLEYAGQLLSVLEYIHGQGLLHRDIKPQNIIIQKDGRAILVDFGLVKDIRGGNTATRGFLQGRGTPEYAPPEQYTGGTDHRSDLYALGATLYHALTGQPPVSVTDQLSGVPLPAPTRLNNQVSPRVEQAILTAMRMKRDERFQSAREFRDQLVQARAAPPYSKPFPAPPSSPAAVLASRVDWAKLRRAAERMVRQAGVWPLICLSLGVLCWAFGALLLSLPGLICGAIAMARLRQQPGATQLSKVVAWSGIALSGANVALSIVAFAVVIIASVAQSIR